MCLGIPGKVVQIKDNGIAVVEFSDGVSIETDANTIEGIRPGDYVIVHAGIIISKLTEEQMEEWARDISDFIKELEEKESELLEMLGGLEEGEVAEEGGKD
ncbi:MAG: HypC/HybG/HupF family hydrogenase formation chaperone [Desulfurococcales archaeon]|nr:HypC/HybG/HupF family hydrogenase formation chaperone [Desulfurococcales archaeon]MCE4626102.1 HypC/HybG/HupF family hydrogenase formation chaperone [Desulfurococcales archaeon]